VKEKKPFDFTKTDRFRLTCGGAVQGVGFRPAVFRLAQDLKLTGFVKNSPEGVTIEIEGAPADAERFIKELPLNLPPLAKLSSFSAEKIAPAGTSGFEIIDSELGKRSNALSSPDSVICPDCRKDMESADNRRMRYIFTNCTNCGPRYTIISSFPYDRERTSMGCFHMCGDCTYEYKNYSDRRFHAEATCCPKCGPRLFLAGQDGRTLKENVSAVSEARKLLAEGKILAIKGLGGFQLAVRADFALPIGELRKRKQRESKPFAVMVRDLDTAKEWAALSASDIEMLTSPKGPIILAARKEKDIDGSIAPGLKDIGIFLPTTPLHIELFRDAPYEALIMTSGNRSDEPIAIGNREALERLAGIADYFLLHDRDILRRVDDSVMRSSDNKPFVVRRSRGFIPESFKIGWESKETILAMGAHLQNTACLVTGSDAFFTPHIGDLDTVKAREFLEESVLSLESFLEAKPGVIAVDLHRDYPSRWLGEKIAKERNIPLIKIQHHLAHLSSVLEEHNKFPLEEAETCCGIILDGTGLGTDNTAWGGEVLSLNSDLKWKRVSHIQAFPLIGNEKAVREPWRVVLGLLSMESKPELTAKLLGASLKDIDLASLAKTTGWELSSGAGRLFEAAGALCGLTLTNRYEGEAAILFESLAESNNREAGIWDDVSLDNNDLFPTAKFFASFAERLSSGIDKATLAMEFHKTFSFLIAAVAEKTIPTGKVIGLSGGCFINRILRTEIKGELEKRGFYPLLPYNIPPGDGGISFGQAVLASRALALGREITEE
jgi:hydrogenase maturation protein HypF